ncbi:MAG TPA: AAA family ATPase [Longimicrobiales bacterium]|nr:AAA family ATPase [Longimicrobiales bacterium]
MPSTSPGTHQASSLERRLAAFLPRFERTRIAAGSDSWTGPDLIEGVGAALFADIAGFTPLTRRLAEEGAGGAERLSEILDATFGRMAGIIERCGGDIVLFAGDAVLAVWPAGTDEHELATATRRAADCGLRVVAALDGAEPEPGVRLRLRASVTAGGVSVFRVGGVDGRWRFVVSGDALRQLAVTDASGAPGEVSVSAEAAPRLGGEANGQAGPGGTLRLREVEVSPEAPCVDPSVVPGIDALRAHVPRAVVHRLEAGQDDWLAEFRDLSLLFAGVQPGSDPDPDPARLHEAVVAIQRVLMDYRGSIYSLAADDKGTSLIAAFGMPPLAVQEPAARALGAAIQMREVLTAAGTECSIGVTTGRVFCGAYGGLERRHYAIVGPAINLAARLMGAAGGGILCDEATRTAAGERVAFGVGRAIPLKGFEAPVPAHVPLTLRTARVRATDRLVGRRRESEALEGVLDAAVEGAGALVVVEGEAGLGKSTLLGAFVAWAEERGVRVVSGGGDALRASTLYFAWRSILEDLLGDAPRERAQRLREALSGDERLLAWAPLLSAIVDVAIPDNETSRDITGEAKALSLQAVVIRVLERAAEDGPLVLLLEDAHWFDAPSHALIHAVAREIPSLCLVLSTRPYDAPPPPEYAAFAALQNVRTLALEPLQEAELPELIALALDVDRVPDELVVYIGHQAGGHPFHSTELALSLRDRGLIGVDAGTCRILTDSGSLEGVRAPASVQEVVLARVDQLGADEQLVLKTASVIGNSFTASMLRDVFPIPSGRAGIDVRLRTLVKRDMIVPSAGGDEEWDTYAFRHAIIADVVYASLPFAQRRELHRSVARWYELEPGAAGRNRAPLLAHHWDRAEEPERALGYLEAAGVSAVSAFSNRDAVRFLSRAVEIQDSGAAAVTRSRRAEWERNLAEARIRLSQYEQAGEHLWRSLAERGLRVHRTAGALGMSLLWHAVVQAGRRLNPVNRMPAGVADGDRRAHGAKVYKRLAEVAYFENDKLRLLHATLAALNLAEASGAIAEQVNGYGSVAIVADLGGMSGLATRYMERAVRVAEKSGRPAVIGRAYLLALIRAVTRGDWEAARASAERSREMFRRTGDAFRWETCTATWGYGLLLQGRVQDALERFEEAVQSARQGSPQTQTWARVGQMVVLLDAEHPVDFVEGEVERLLEAEHQSRTEQLTCAGMLALAALRRGERERASELARRTLAWLGGEAPAVYYPLWSIAGAAEVLLADAEDEPLPAVAAARASEVASPGSDPGPEPARDAGRASAREGLEAAVKVLRAHGRMFPICVPTARYYEGRLEELKGRPERARALFAEGVEAARDLDMPRFAARLELAGATSESDSGKRKE